MTASMRWMLAALWLEVAGGMSLMLFLLGAPLDGVSVAGVLVCSTSAVVGANAGLRALAWRGR